MAGFKTMHVIDSSRIYKPGSTTSDPLHYRSVHIDVWYPATASVKNAPLEFKDFLSPFVRQADYYSGHETKPGAVNEAALAFCDMNQCSDSSRLLHSKTASFKNARQAPGKFPLVLYFASYGSSPFENYTLLEHLAQRGCMVVAIGSVGRFPGDMTMNFADMMEQVKDGWFALRYLSKSNIDFSKTAIVGYSWGGVSAVVAAGKLAGVRCVVSLDGSEFHHYGYNKTEDTDFDGIAGSKDFKKLTVPYLRLQQGPEKAGSSRDSVYDFSKKLSRSICLAVDSAEHFHFCCIKQVVRASGNCGSDPIYHTISQLAINFLEDELIGTKKFPAAFKEHMGSTVKEVASNMNH